MFFVGSMTSPPVIWKMCSASAFHHGGFADIYRCATPWRAPPPRLPRCLEFHLQALEQGERVRGAREVADHAACNLRTFLTFGFPPATRA